MTPSLKSHRPVNPGRLPDQSKPAPAVPSPLPLVAPVQTGGRGEGQGEVWALTDRSFKTRIT
jgi:hypothetical protein